MVGVMLLMAPGMVMGSDAPTSKITVHTIRGRATVCNTSCVEGQCWTTCVYPKVEASHLDARTYQQVYEQIEREEQAYKKASSDYLRRWYGPDFLWVCCTTHRGK